MSRYVAPKPDRERAGAGYRSPNQLLGRNVKPRADRRRVQVEVRGPKDLRLGDAVAVMPEASSAASDAQGAAAADRARREARAAQDRIAALERDLAAARTVEHTAVGRLERAEASARAEREVMLVEARAERERLQEELRLERERHDRETAKLRALLDQRERELRTLALEMGKVQGRLEVAERRLVETRAAPRGREALDGPAASARRRWSAERWVAVAAILVVGLFVGLVAVPELMQPERSGAGSSEVQAAGHAAASPSR